MSQSTLVTCTGNANQNFPVFNDILAQLDEEFSSVSVASSSTVSQQHSTDKLQLMYSHAYQQPASPYASASAAASAYYYQPHAPGPSCPQQYREAQYASSATSSVFSTNSASISSSRVSNAHNCKHMHTHNNQTSILHLLSDAPKTQLKDFVFISKQFVQRLSEYIVSEPWGHECSLLYKYVDYIFRCQSFARQVMEVVHDHNGVQHRFLLFHSGLQRRSDNQFLYGLLIPNTISAQQAWRVQFGAVHNSFMSKHELFKRLREFDIAPMRDAALPQRTQFHSHVCDMYYDATREIRVDWSQRLTTNQDRIFKVMGKAAFQQQQQQDGGGGARSRHLRMYELAEAFNAALHRTKLMAQMNARIAVPQGFVDNKCGKYRMELLLPLTVQFPCSTATTTKMSDGGNARYYKFALAIAKDKQQQQAYVVKSILTLEMAYANARLCGYVDSIWLTQQKDKHGNGDINRFCVSP